MSDNGDDDQTWDDWVEDEEDRVPATCLLCSELFPSAPEAFAHLSQHHHCDVLQACRAWALDFYGFVRLINYIRRWRLEHPGPDAVFRLPADAAEFAGEQYLRPVLQDDPLLQYDIEGEGETEEEEEGGGGHGDGALGVLVSGAGAREAPQQGDAEPADPDALPDLADADAPPPAAAVTSHAAVAPAPKPGAPSPAPTTAFSAIPSSAATAIPDPYAMVSVSAHELAALRARLQASEQALQQLQGAYHTLREAAEHAMLGGTTAAELRADGADAGGARKGAAAATDTDSDEEQTAAAAAAGEEGHSYFSSYAHFGIHEEMIKDTVRTQSYRDAILRNPGAFHGKVVLDVGCGTGILSMFAARAGARRVYAVDNSEIALLAREIVARNGLGDVVQVLQGKVEHVPLGEKVDVIVSEWMGYGLLFESMLDSVLHARDRHLAPGGLVLPDKTALYLVGLSDEAGHASHVRFWEHVYDFDMTPMLQPVLAEAAVQFAPARSAATTPATLVSLDLATCTVADLTFSAPFAVTASAAAPLMAFCIYFDIVFEEGLENSVYFSTSPADTPTHWKQTLLYLHKPVAVRPGDVVSGTLAYERSKDDHRSLVIRLTFAIESLEGENTPACTLSYRL